MYNSGSHARLFLQGPRRLCRSFKTEAEHIAWRSRVVGSRMRLPASAVVHESGAEVAPFMWCVDRLSPLLRYRSVPRDVCVKDSPTASMLDVCWPISSNPFVRSSVQSLSSWNSFRFAKFYEALDALTADVAYRHTDGLAKGLSLVTAGHHHSQKLSRDAPDKDVHLRCYVTAAGSASLEVRTDALQADDSGEEHLVNFCHTTMVAVDQTTHRPRKGSVPPLAVDPDGLQAQNERSELAEMHQEIRKRRSSQSLFLRDPISHAPTQDEMERMHKSYQEVTRIRESPVALRSELPDTVGFHTHSNSFVVKPEHHNVQGTLFGGVIVARAFEIAYYAAMMFMYGQAFDPIAMDGAMFHQPVAPGDMVKMTAHVVHSESSIFRVMVFFHVVDPTDPNRWPTRTNTIMFVFAGHPNFRRNIFPETYPEILMHIGAGRRAAEERPCSEMLQSLFEYLREQEEAKQH